MIVGEYDGDQDNDNDDFDDDFSPSLVAFLYIKDGQTAVHSIVNAVLSSRADCLMGIMITDDDDDIDGDDDHDYDDNDPVITSRADCLV